MTLLFALTTLTASAEVGDVVATGTCGENVTWTLTENGDKVYKTSQVYPGLTLTVTGTGAMSGTSYADLRFYGDTGPKSSTLITEIIIGEGITSINGFGNGSYDVLRRASLPSTLTTIPQGAFQNCKALRSIVIPDGVNRIMQNTFLGCDSLRSVTIGSGVTQIMNAAFKNCAQLMTVRFKRYVPGDSYPITMCPVIKTTLPESHSFYGCVDLASIVVPEGSYDDYWNWYQLLKRYTIGTDDATLEGYSYEVVGAYTYIYPTRTDRDTLFAAGSTNEWRTWCDNVSHAAPKGVEVYAVNCVENRMVKLKKITATVTLPEDEREGAGDDGVRAFIPAFVPVLIKRPSGEVTAPIVAKFVMGGDITPENGWNSIRETTTGGPIYDANYFNSPTTTSMDMIPYGYTSISYQPVFYYNVAWKWGYVLSTYGPSNDRILGNACSYSRNETSSINYNFFILEGDEFKRVEDTSKGVPMHQFALEIEPVYLGSDTDSPVPLKVYYELSLDDNGDNTDVIATAVANGNTCDRLTLSDRALYKDGNWNTLCLPFSMDATQIAASPLADVTIMELDGTSSHLTNSTLTLNFKAATTIEAGKPYIVKWATPAADILNPIFSSVTVTSTTPTPVTFPGGQFVGTYDKLSFTDEDRSILFLGADNKLYYPLSGAHIGACRAYFDLGTNSPAKSFVLNFDGEDNDPTAIEAVESQESRENPQSSILNPQSLYDLQGRRVSSPFRGMRGGLPPGIYIHNGKKIIVK